MSDELQYLIDRQAIEDVLNRYARGVDRHDVEIMRSVFHEDAIDNHGPFVGGPAPFTDWVNDLHAGKTHIHMHNMTCCNCEVDGDVAWTETYVAFVLHLSTTGKLVFGSGRYVDKLEKRNGAWKIALRRTMTDSRFAGEPVAFGSADRSPRGRWDRDDLSYEEMYAPGGSL